MRPIYTHSLRFSSDLLWISFQKVSSCCWSPIFTSFFFFSLPCSSSFAQKELWRPDNDDDEEEHQQVFRAQTLGRDREDGGWKLAMTTKKTYFNFYSLLIRHKKITNLLLKHKTEQKSFFSVRSFRPVAFIWTWTRMGSSRARRRDGGKRPKRRSSDKRRMF